MWYMILWVSSLFVPVLAQTDVVTLFSYTNYQGNNLTLSVSNLTLSANNLTQSASDWTLPVYPFISLPEHWAFQIQSLKVQQGFEFVGFDEPYENSQYMIWDESSPDMGKLWRRAPIGYNVRAQSKELTEKPNSSQKVAILKNSATTMTLNLQPGNIDSAFGNVSEMSVTAGYEVTLYSNLNQTGNATVYTSDFVGANLQIASYSVQKIPTTTAPVNILVPSTASTNNTAVIVGSVLGTLVVIGVIAFIVVKKLKKTTSNDKTEPLIEFTGTKAATKDVGSLDIEALQKHRLDANGLQLEQAIGFGSFAEVWRGTYNGQLVAVKKLQRSRCTNRDIQDFIKEIALTASFDCASIIKVVGAIWTTPADIKAVMEFMDLGDLRDYLVNNSPSVFTWNQKYKLLQTVAEGLAYLHSLSIIHRDLKSRNVLLDSTKGVKLVDFGIAKEDIQATMTRGVGTFRWMAPEVLMESSYTVAADVYSFGMLVSEIDTHCIPYDDMKNPKTGLPLADPVIIRGVMDGTIKPTFTESCPEWIKSLATSCLQFDPDSRPTMYEVITILKKSHMML